MRKVVLTLLAMLLWSTPTPAWRAISIVQTAAIASIDDASLAFASSTTAGNVVIAGYRLATDAQTINVQSVTEVELHRENSSGGQATGIVCFETGSGGNNYVFQSNAGGAVAIAALEVSGTDGCTEDGTSDGRFLASSASPIAADTPPTIQSGSIVFGVATSGNNSTMSCDGSYTCVPGTPVSQSLIAQYQIAGSAGTYDSPFTWTGTEGVVMAVAGVAASGGGATPCGRRGLLRVGCEN
jgi:hypothetical protein